MRATLRIGTQARKILCKVYDEAKAIASAMNGQTKLCSFAIEKKGLKK